MTRLYLVRHGETQWNKENRCQGCIDIELSEDGLKQAYAVAKRLVREHIDIIYSSTLKRAVSTANVIADELALQVTGNQSLNEISFGEWEGLTFEEMRLRPDYNFNLWTTQPHMVNFPGEGNLQNVQARAMKFVNQIIDDNLGKNILIVSHGGVLKLVILGLLNMRLEDYSKFYLTNASVSIVNIDKERSYLRTLNETCHLAPSSMPIF